MLLVYNCTKFGIFISAWLIATHSKGSGGIPQKICILFNTQVVASGKLAIIHVIHSWYLTSYSDNECFMIISVSTRADLGFIERSVATHIYCNSPI